MTREELLKRIQAEGIADWAYTIGKHSSDDGYVARPDGDRWVVYIMERGHPDVFRECKTEEEAYDRLWWLLMRDRGVRAYSAFP